MRWRSDLQLYKSNDDVYILYLLCVMYLYLDQIFLSNAVKLDHMELMGGRKVREEVRPLFCHLLS